MSDKIIRREPTDPSSDCEKYAYLLNNTVIERRRLLLKSPAVTLKRITILEAPAGYGKAVLMAQWAEHARAKGLPASWHTISDEDNSRETLLGNLSDLRNAEGNHLFFIDKTELLKDPSSISALGKFIETADRSILFVISSRRGSVIPVSGYRSHDQLVDINAGDLAFTVEEVSSLFKNSLSRSMCEQLFEFTRGWPVALWYEHYRHGHNRDMGEIKAEPALGYLSAELSEFIQEQIFCLMESPVRRMLMKMSIFQQFTLKQARFLCDINVAGNITTMRPFSPLIYSPPGKAEAFLFNPAFKEFLREKLFESKDIDISDLHQKAASWCESQGEIYEAIYHAAQADDISRMLELFIVGGGVEIGLRKGIKYLESIIELFPLNVGEDEPQLLLSRVLIYIKDGRFGIGNSLFNRASQKLAESGHDPSMEYYKSIVSMLTAVYEDREISLAEIVQFENHAHEVMPERFWSQGWFNNLLCMMYYSVGQMNKAKEAAKTSLEFYSLSDAIYSQYFIHIHLALISNVFGDLTQSGHELEQAEKLCAEYFPNDTGLNAIVQILKAELNYEKGISKATQPVSGYLERIEAHEGWVEIFVRGYITASYLEFENGSTEGAIRILDRGNAIAKRRNLPRLNRILEIQKLELLTLSGNFKEALSLIKSLSLEKYINAPKKYKAGSFQESYRTIQALARYCICKGLGEAALNLLECVVDVQKRARHGSFLTRSTILTILALDSIGKHDEADALFQEISCQPYTHEFMMSFLRAGKPLKRFVNEHVKRVTVSKLPQESVAFIGQILARKDVSVGFNDRTSILTSKEFQVLQNLSLGHSNKSIGLSMGVSETTVKFHLRNIFSKIGVQNRMMAVEVARQKNILS